MLVKVDAERVRRRRQNHVRHELSADRDARLIFSVLTGVAVALRHHAGDARRRRASRGVDQDSISSEVLGRRIRRLDDEHVVAADVLVDADGDLAVRESAGFTRHRSTRRGCDLLGERPIGRPRQQRGRGGTASPSMRGEVAWAASIERWRRDEGWCGGGGGARPFPLQLGSRDCPGGFNHHSRIKVRCPAIGRGGSEL